MSSFRIFDIAGSGVAAQTVRLNTVASNLANANSVSSSPDTTYRARMPVFESIAATLNGRDDGAAVRVRDVIQSNATPNSRYEPSNPLADANGFVYQPDISAVEQITDMVSASRSYQNNIEVMRTARDLMMATLRLGQQ
ncbi:MAG: flagellar basal body rod protein FlgC [Gammaproteobacteria bacterium]|jgi:flagellar basal-body rod protein FlgC